MNIRNLALILGAIALTGCAHSVMRGSVAMKINETQGHVCLGNKDVKVGDHVIAYTNFCLGKGGARTKGDSIGLCEKRNIGAGTITQLLNEHYSVVTFDEGAKFDEGTFVEKQ